MLICVCGTWLCGELRVDYGRQLQGGPRDLDAVKMTMYGIQIVSFAFLRQGPPL